MANNLKESTANPLSMHSEEAGNGQASTRLDQDTLAILRSDRHDRPSTNSQDDLVASTSGRIAGREGLGGGFGRGFGSMLRGQGSPSNFDGGNPGLKGGGTLNGGGGLRLQGRSKSMNVSSLLDSLDKDEDVWGIKAKGGPMVRKGFYAKSQTFNGSAPAGSPGTPGGQAATAEKKGGFYAMGKGGGNSPGERKIMLSSSLKNLEGSPTNDDDWAETQTLGRSKTFQEQEGSSGLSSQSPRSRSSPGGDSVADRSGSAGSPSPRSSVEGALPPPLDPPGSPRVQPSSPAPGRAPAMAQKKDGKRDAAPAFPKPFMSGLFWNANKSGKVADNPAKGENAPPLALEGSDRFSLLLLEEGEYYFKDYSCHYHPQAGGEQNVAELQAMGPSPSEAVPLRKVPGTVKVCSESIFFVPRSGHEPVFRIEYRNTECIERGTKPISADEADSPEGEDFFVVKASERTDVRIGNRHVPYKAYKGDFVFHFTLVYTSLNAMLPRVQKLMDISKGPVEEKAKRLNALVKRHEEELHFNAGWFDRADESLLLEFVGSRITPLVSQPGRIVLTAWNVYFQPFNVVSSAPVQRYKLENLTSVMKRTSVLEEVGVELFSSAWNSVYFMFKSPKDCSSFYSALLNQPGLSLEKMKSVDQWQKEWVAGQVSNFDYLMFLNREANRSFNDLSQYPVFPWVIADYKSKRLDLTRPETFRDLSKPIGALDPERLQDFKERYRELADSYEDWCEDFAPAPPPPNVPGTPSPPYLYGCHYSTPGYVVFFKLRDQPQLMLRLQNGRYDMPDRLLSSIPDLWDSAITKSTDLKELIPEFYSMNPSFLLNIEGLDFGCKQSGEKVNDVELPPWAEDATEFCRKMREALESPYVSRKLHKWINLIFGCKQQGAAALEADNVFHPLTYDDVGAEVLASIDDDNTRRAIRVQMREFGRTPKQLFRTLHPRQRRSEVRKLMDFLYKCRRYLQIPLLLSTVPVRQSVVRSVGTATKTAERQSRLPAGHSSLARRKYLYPAVLAGALLPLAELGRQDRSVYRAIARVVSKDPPTQKFALEWLEQNAALKAADNLEVTKPRHLAPIVALAQSRRPEKRVAAMRATAALAQSWPNRHLILAAGLLDHIQYFLCNAPHGEGTKAAVAALSRLSTEEAAVESCGQDTMDVLLGLLSKARPEQEEESFAETQAYACEALGNLAVNQEHHDYMISMRAIDILLPLAQAGEDNSAELREMALRALASLAVGHGAQMQLVRSGGLSLALRTCEEETGLVQEAAAWLVASLAANSQLRTQIAAEGGLRLLCWASCAKEQEIREAAALGLSWLCEEASIISSLVGEGGLWTLIAMSQSPHPEVQRLAAGAFWHLAVHYENKRQVVDMGGLQSLLTLSQLGERNPQATSLAEEALLKLADDDEMRLRLEGDDSYILRARSIIREVLPTPTASPRPSAFSSTLSSPASSVSGHLASSFSLNLPRTRHLTERSVSMNDSLLDRQESASRTPLSALGRNSYNSCPAELPPPAAPPARVDGSSLRSGAQEGAHAGASPPPHSRLGGEIPPREERALETASGAQAEEGGEKTAAGLEGREGPASRREGLAALQALARGTPEVPAVG